MINTEWYIKQHPESFDSSGCYQTKKLLIISLAYRFYDSRFSGKPQH
jgi:hypothetical protein